MVGLGAKRHRCSRNEEGGGGGGGRVRKGLVREKVVVDGWGGFGFGERKDEFRKAGTVAMWCGRLFFLVGALRWG